MEILHARQAVVCKPPPDKMLGKRAVIPRRSQLAEQRFRLL